MRRKVAEWWEVWWKKPGHDPVRQIGPGGMPANPRLHRDAFVSREEARERLRQARNKYLRIVHVVRYRGSPNESEGVKGG